MAAIAPVPTETAARRSWLFLHRYRKAPSQPSIRPLAFGDVAWKTAQRFPLMGTAALSGQGCAVVHATGYGLFRVLHPEPPGWRIAPFSRASASVVKWVEPHGCGERSRWAMDGPSGPTPERRWRERTRSAAEGRMTGASVFGYFCPGRAAATGKSDSPEGAKQETSAEFDERLWHQESRVCCTETLGFASAQPNLQNPQHHLTQNLAHLLQRSR